MEETIIQFRNNIARVCHHLESTSSALLQSVNRRPIPFDSASSSFVNCLNRRVSTAATDLNLLDSMALDTVSFEELLGHCNEIYKSNELGIVEVQDRLSSLYGYVDPGLDIDEHEEEDDMNDSQLNTSLNLSTTMEDDDSLFDDTLSLQKFGISDASLATLESEGTNKIEMDPLYEPAMDITRVEKDVQNELKSHEDLKSFIDVSKDVYESLPSFMKFLVSWEDLFAAVEKMNLHLKQKTKSDNFFTQDEVSSLNLGPKTRSYFLLLVKMNCLVVETIDGLISYRVLKASGL